MDEKGGHRAGSHLDLLPQVAERAPHASDARFQTMADESPVILWESDASGDNRFANQTFGDFFGITFDEEEGRRWQPLLHPEDAPSHLEAFFKAVREHTRFSNEARHRRKDGEWRWLLVQARPRYAPTGEFLGHVGVCVDVTERRQAEDALRESEEQLRALSDNLPNVAFYRYQHDENGTPRFLYISRHIEKLTGVSPEEVLRDARSLLDTILPEDRERRERAETRSLETLTPFESEVRMRHGVTGEERWALLRSVPFRRSDGTTIWHGLHIDITELKRTEQALHEQERRYRWLFENSLDAVYVTRHADGIILDANPAACALHGMTVDEIRERGRAGLVVADDRLAAGLMRRALHGEGRTELNFLRKDGTTFPAEVESIIVGPDGSELSAFVIARDITERKRAEGMLRGTLQRFYSVLSSMYSPVLILTSEDSVEFANAGFCEAFRLVESPDELVGLSASELVGKIRDGYLHPEEAIARIEEILRLGQAVKGEEVALRDGRTCLRDVVPLSVDGEPRGRLWLHFDITERKRAEEALREEDRRKAEFLAVLSHELRNPLAPIRNSIYLLERSAAGTKQATRAVEVIRRQTEHLTRLIDDLLDVTRISRGKIVLRPIRVNLRDIVRKTTDDLRSLFAEAGVELHVDDTSGPAWIIADPTRITQVLGNLLQNAVKFTPAGGSTTVTLATKGGHAEIRVRDSGAGMEPEKIEHMFAPFVQAEVTLARTKGGLGLGLPLVKGFVELHGGAVEAHSDGVGRGAEFVVRLPLAELRAEAGHERREVAEASARTVLVIEDNVDAGQTLAEVLELQGHHARVARDGRTGLKLAHELRPEVVLCDIGLPDIDGYEVARVLRCDEALRATRLVALSGYAQPEDQQRAREAGFDAHLAKPPDIEELAKLL
jgi:PAS domain S-box-containing protein